MIRYVDALARIGPRPNKHPAQPWSLDHLRAEMAHCSISGALVSSTLSVQYDPLHGNRALSAQLAGRPDTWACWTLLPAGTGEMPGGRPLLRLLEQHGVRAGRLHPRSNGWELESSAGRELLQTLARARLLTILDRSEFETYAQLDRLLGAHPRLPLLLSGAIWNEQRWVWPLLRDHPNLHLTFDHFQIHQGLEELAAEGWEDRLLFGTNAPAMSMGSHRCYVDYAQLSARTRSKIAGGNLLRLLGVRPPPERRNPLADELMCAAQAGAPLPTPVIDLHMHILDEGLNGGGGRFRMFQGGPSGVFPTLPRLGYVGGGFMSWSGPVACDPVAGNACVQAALDAAPPGYWGLATFDPTHFSQSELLKLIPATYADRRFIGMKPYFSFGVPYDDPAYAVWWEYGQRHRLYAGIHRTRDDFREIDALARKYPRIRWVVYHCGKDYATADQAIAAIRRHPNVYAEITLTPVTLGVIDYLVEHAGADRVVYGSDLPMRDPRQQLGWMVYSRLSVADKRRILGGNAREVLAPCLSRLPVRCRPSPHARHPRR